MRRPDIAKVVRADLDIIKNLAQLVERQPPQPGCLQAAELWLVNLSVRSNASSISRPSGGPCSDAGFSLPTIRPLTSRWLSKSYRHSSVIAMEFIEGVSINDLAGHSSHECRTVQSRGDRCADFAPADLRVRLLPRGPASGKPPRPRGGVIAPLDYGMFGQLDGKTRERIADLLSRAAWRRIQTE